MRNGACLSNENKNFMLLETVKVCKNVIEILRDTGCSGVIVRRKLIKEDDFTASMGYAIVIDQTLKKPHIA